EAAAPQTDTVDAARDRGIALDDQERRHITHDDGGDGRETALAEAAELVNAGKAAENDMVVNLHVSGQRTVVGKNGLAAHLAVMGKMAIGHDPVVVADTRHTAAARRAAIDAAIFTYRIAAADLEARRATGQIELLVLRIV